MFTYDLDYKIDVKVKQKILSQMSLQPLSERVCPITGTVHTFLNVNTKDNNIFITDEIKSLQEEVTKLITLPDITTIIKCLPNTDMRIHTDRAPERLTLLNILLTDACGSDTSLRFYSGSGKDSNIINEYIYTKDNNALLINTSIPHQAVNYTNYSRYTLQFGFAKPIEEVVKLYHRNQL